jgi:hypothetical protein
MGGIAENGDPAARPARQFQNLELVPSACAGETVDQRLEMGKRPGPHRRRDRQRPGFLVGRLATQRHVEIVPAGRRVEHAAGARKIFDVTVAIAFRNVAVAARDQQARGAVFEGMAIRQETEGIAYLRIDAVGADDEIGFDRPAARQFEASVGRRADGFRTGDDVDAGAPAGIGQRTDQRLTQDRNEPRRPGLVDGNTLHHGIEVVTRLEGRALMAAGAGLVVSVDRLEDSQAVAPDVNAGAEGAQVRRPFVHLHPPPALREGCRGRQAADATAGDLGGKGGVQRQVDLPRSATRSDACFQ